MELQKKSDQDLFNATAEAYSSIYTGEAEPPPDEYVFTKNKVDFKGAAIFDIMAEEQAKAPEGFFFTGYDEQGKPKYGQYGSSYMEAMPTSDPDVSSTGWKRTFVPLTMDSTETKIVMEDGKRVEKTIKTGEQLHQALATQEYNRFLNKQLAEQRAEKEAAGGWSMGAFIKASGGDPVTTAKFMEERGLSMDVQSTSYIQ